MDVQVVLVFITALPAVCAISNNGTGPRGFALSKHTETFTYEPFDYPFPEERTRKSQASIPHLRNINVSIRHGDLCNSSSKICIRTVFNVSEQAEKFLQGALATRFIPTIYALVFAVSVPLNSIALVAFCWRIGQKKSVVVYMTHLALADVLFGALLPLKVQYYVRGSDWVFGEAACRFITAAFYCYMYCSVLLVMCMSIDRMLAVAMPIASSCWRRPHNAARLCAGAWILALVGATPLLTIQQTMEIEEIGTTCHDVLDNPLYQQLFAYIICILFILPLVVTMSCYGVIFHLLRPSRLLQRAVASSLLARKRRRRAAVMVAAVVLEFVVCFAPTNALLLLHCAQLMMRRDADRRDADGMYAAYMVSVCVGSISTCLDPLIYYFGSSQCREQIKSTFCLKKKKQTDSNSHCSSSLGICQYGKQCRTRTPLIS
ncbi:proteinase-activated receptor 1-like [Hoplias malabaricus]|uniref:proteinase-activated receptor 1-like n=1 Tax=Hoplias malabaricus TaxID=27720 RepID=UPI0034637791